MGLIASPKFVGGLILAVVVKSVLVAGLLVGPIGAAPSLASEDPGDDIDVSGNGTAPSDDVPDDPTSEDGTGDDDSQDGGPGDCILVCGPTRLVT